LSASQETRLQPKKPWTHHTMPEEKLAALLNAIVGFSVAFETLHGKFKLSQDKTPDDVAGVIAHLEALADPRAQAMADAMGVRLKPAG
jgi:transcriptional regulator